MKKGIWFMCTVMVVGLSSCEREPSGQEAAEIELRLKPPSEAVEELVYLEDVSETWLVLFGFETGGKWLPKLRGDDGKITNRTEFNRPLKPGEFFFHEGPMLNRFKFIKIEERVIHHNRLNIQETLRFAVFEDQLPSKKGRRYEVPNRLPRALEHEYYQADKTALLTVEKSEPYSDSFKVEEGARFALPPDAENQAFLLKSVSPDEIVVEWGEGDTAMQKTIALKN